MKNQSQEERRAFNIIWNASADYSLKPEIKAYDENGKAELYWNYIIGAAHKYYDFSLLTDFFRYLKKNTNHSFFEKLTWIGLENCTFQKARHERPVLENLRLCYAKKVVCEGEKSPSVYFYDEIKIAHFQRVLGEKPRLSDSALDLLKALEFDESMNTKQIIQKMKEIIRTYFEISSLHTIEIRNNKKSPWKIRLSGFGSHFSKQLTLGSGGFDASISFAEDIIVSNKIALFWNHMTEQLEKKQRESMQRNFGLSILSEMQTQALEKILCTGNHKNCHLHFTRGEFELNQKAAGQGKAALIQKEKNIRHYKENFARNHHSISKLTSRIMNTILVNLESSANRSVTGKLVVGKVWRSRYVDDNKVFIKDFQDDLGKISVDIMLDASASQAVRQETIAEEGYVIAESLTRCMIPVKVYSFFDRENYLIINLFRDYGEINGNDNIFNYNAIGCNRDGLAIRTALHMMEKSPYEKKILIVLSDAKPNDVQQPIYTDKWSLGPHDYSEAPAINDTAREVREGLRRGISIFCIFTGLDADIPAAKKIYKHNFARIKSVERFADTVGTLIQNELRNL